MSGNEAGAPAETVVVQLVPDNLELVVNLEAPAGGATVGWLKAELCQQDPTGEATPSDFRLCSASRPGKALGDGDVITAAMIPLVVMAQDEGAAVDDQASQAEEERAREEAEQREREEAERKEEAARKTREYFAERKAKEEEEERAKEAERKAKEEAEERARQEEEAARRAKEEAERREREEEEAARRAKEEAERREREEEEQKARAAAERRAKEEAELKEREEAERRAEEERRAQKAAELAEQKAKAEAEEKAQAEAEASKKLSVAERARESAKEGVEVGTATIQVAFKYKGQSWNKSFEVDRGCIVLDLKNKMMAKAPEEAGWFELQRGGRRISDMEPIRGDESFVFCWLGPQQGPRLAARDLERKASEQAMEEALAAEKALANQDIEVDVRLKKGVWEERRISVTVKGGATTMDVREAVAKSTGEDVTRICLFEDGDAPEPMEDDERIGLRREFRARCAAPEGHQATAAELWQAADDLKWFAWHEIWVAAYEGYAAKRQGPEKTDLLEKAKEDSTMGSKHYQAIEESKSFPSRLLRRLRQQAEVDGRAAAEAALEWADLDTSTLKALDPPRDTDEDLWAAIVETLHVAAVEVVGMITHHNRPAKISNTNFHPAWQKVVGRLCGPIAGGSAESEPPATLPLVLGTELKWLIWNDLWRAANKEYANGTEGPKKGEKFAKCKEDAARAEGHFEAVKAMGTFSAETLERIKQRVEAGGKAAGQAALKEQALDPETIEATPAPSEQEINSGLWSQLAGVIAKCAAAVADMSVEGVFHFIVGKMHMVDFEVAIRRICDPPFQGEPRESNESVAPARTKKELDDAKKAIPFGKTVTQYEKEFLVGPLQVLDPPELTALKQDFDAFLNRDLRQQWPRLFNTHVLCSWVYKLATNPKIVATVAGILKTDTVMLHSSALIPCEVNRAGLDPHVSEYHWHAEGQSMMDSMGSLEHYVTVMVALTPCAKASGCAEFVMGPGMPTKKMELQPGECSFSHPSVYYRMLRNGSGMRRDSIHLRYISGIVRDTYAELHESEPRDLVLLVAGKDSEGHFRLLKPPSEQLGGEEVQTWERVRLCRERRFKGLK